MKRARAEELGRLLLDVAPRVMRLETKRLSALDPPLTHRQYRILQRVGQGVTSSTAISQAANISLAAISESVEAMRRRGFLAREPDERDRRAIKLVLTSEGQVALTNAEKTLDELAGMLAAGLTIAELERLHEGLIKIVDNVREQHQRFIFDNDPK